MREIFTYGSVGRTPGNRRLYLEGDEIIASFTFILSPKVFTHIQKAFLKVAPDRTVVHKKI